MVAYNPLINGSLQLNPGILGNIASQIQAAQANYVPNPNANVPNPNPPVSIVARGAPAPAPAASGGLLANAAKPAVTAHQAHLIHQARLERAAKQAEQTKISGLTPQQTPPPATINTTPLPRGNPPADLSMYGGGLLPSITGFAQPQTTVDPNNTYLLARPTKGLLAKDTTEFQTRDGVQGFQFVTNKGNPADIKQKEVNEKRNLGGPANPTGFVPYVEGAKYRIWNEKGKDRILYEGEGADALKKTYRYAQNLSATQGKKANWAVEMWDPNTQQWSRVADDDPAKGLSLGTIAKLALPVGGALLAGPLGLGAALGTGTAATAGIGAALGSGLGGAIAGDSFGDILKNAVITGGTTFAGGTLLGPGSSAGTGATTGATTGAATGATAGSAIGSAVPEIVVTGATSLLPAATGAVVGTGASTALTGSGSSSSQGTATTPGEEIVVSAQPGAGVDTGAVVGAGTGTAGGEIVVSGDTGGTLEDTGAATGATADEIVVSGDAGGTLEDTGAATGATADEIVVSGNNGTVLDDVSFPDVVPQINEAELQDALNEATNPDGSIDYTKLAMRLFGAYSLLSGLGGGGGGGVGTPYTSTLGPVPTFGRGDLSPYTGDYETYATRPEHQFFKPLV